MNDTRFNRTNLSWGKAARDSLSFIYQSKYIYKINYILHFKRIHIAHCLWPMSRVGPNHVDI